MSLYSVNVVGDRDIDGDIRCDLVLVADDFDRLTHIVTSAIASGLVADVRFRVNGIVGGCEFYPDMSGFELAGLLVALEQTVESHR